MENQHYYDIVQTVYDEVNISKSVEKLPNIDLGCLISSDVILGQTFAIYV